MNILSSLSQPMYQRENFMKKVPSPKYGEPAWVDIFDAQLLEIARKAPIAKQVEYRNVPITTISYDCYGTTSLWWLLVMINGFLFAEEIPLGYMLKIPSLAQMANKFKPKPANASKMGQVVRV